jgi:hypothetical protein
MSGVDDKVEFDTHLALALMRLTTMGFDPETKQANLFLTSFFTKEVEKLGTTKYRGFV